MNLQRLYEELEKHYDVKGWWPYSDPWEVMVGSVLTQQTNWNNVMTSIEALRKEGLLPVKAMAAADREKLEKLLRPCGFYRQKAQRLQDLAIYIRDDFGADPVSLLRRDDARELLLSRPGIGPETADSIMVFAAGRPYFVAAAYCRRVLSRTGVINSDDYGEVQEFVHQQLGRDSVRLSSLYAMIVEHAKRYCLARPNCRDCFLAEPCCLIAREREDCPPQPRTVRQQSSGRARGSLE